MAPAKPGEQLGLPGALHPDRENPRRDFSGSAYWDRRGKFWQLHRGMRKPRSDPQEAYLFSTTGDAHWGTLTLVLGEPAFSLKGGTP